MKPASKVGVSIGVFVIVVITTQVAFAQVEWTMEEVVVEPGPPGSWNEGRNLLGDVVFDGVDYHMYLVGGQGSNPLENSWSIGHWVWNSVDLKWDPDPANPVLEPGSPGAWDAWGVINFAVLHDGGSFHMWYGAKAVYHGTQQGGYATNPNGWGDWDKHSANPLPGLEPGTPDEWDEGGPNPCTVLADGPIHRMWFDTGSGGTWNRWDIGYAMSTDGGLSWTRHRDPVLRATEPWEGIKVYLPEVVPYGDGFAMWYSAQDGVTAAMGYAVSSDGINWRKWIDNPVLLPIPPCVAVDSTAVFLEGDTVHGWVGHCYDVCYATSSFEVFSDGFETGDTSSWSATFP